MHYTLQVGCVTESTFPYWLVVLFYSLLFDLLLTFLYL